MSEVKDKAKERLSFGLLNDVDLLKRVNENTIRTSVPVSISTRGIGFGLTTTYRALTNYGDARPPSVYAVGFVCRWICRKGGRNVQTSDPSSNHIEAQRQRQVLSTARKSNLLDSQGNCRGPFRWRHPCNGDESSSNTTLFPDAS